jgi:hypothetical protein
MNSAALELQPPNAGEGGDTKGEGPSEDKEGA